MSKQKRTFAIDFDGVLHTYSGWRHGILDDPIVGAHSAVMRLLDMGHEVVVFTTRDRAFVAAWLVKHGFPQIEVTSDKRPFWVMIDDRCIRFEGSWDGVVEAALAFEPYWVRAQHPGRATKDPAMPQIRVVRLDDLHELTACYLHLKMLVAELATPQQQAEHAPHGVVDESAMQRLMDIVGT